MFIELAVYCCLPPSDSGIAHCTWEIFRQGSGSFHIFTSLGLQDIASLQGKLARSDQRVLPAKFARFARRRVDYGTHLFVLGNSKHHVPAVEELALLSRERCQVIAHFHEPLMSDFWSHFFNHDVVTLKKFLQLFYPERAAALKKAESCEDIRQIDCLGLRPFRQIFRIDKMVFNSTYASELACSDLTGRMRGEVLFHPIFEPDFAHACFSSEPTLTIGHFGIPSLEKGIPTLIAACDIIARCRPVKLMFAGWHASRNIAAMCPEGRSFISCVDGPDDHTFISTMSKIHLAVQLRPKAHGESSGAVHALLSRGKTVIVSDIGNFKDYGDAVVRVPPNVTPETLAEAILSNFTVDKRALIEPLLGQYSLAAFHERLGAMIRR